MASARLFTLAALTCVIPALISCAHEIESVDRQVERELAEFHASCLSPARPAYSPAHTDCVLSRYEERQRELARLRNTLAREPLSVAQAAPSGGAAQGALPAGTTETTSTVVAVVAASVAVGLAAALSNNVTTASHH